MENRSSDDCDQIDLNKINNYKNINENGKTFNNIDYYTDKENKKSVSKEENEKLKKNDNIISYPFEKSQNNKNEIVNPPCNNKISLKDINDDKLINDHFNNFKKKIEVYYQKIFNGEIKKLFIHSIINENNNYYLNKIFWDIYNSLKNIEMDKFEQIYKEKLITIFCLLYYFVIDDKPIINENILNFKLSIEQNLIKFLQKNILFPEIDNFEFSKSKIKIFSRNFSKNLDLNSINIKKLIFSSYTFLIIYRFCKEYQEDNTKTYFKELLVNDYLISFKIHFILKYRELYPSIIDKFFEIYQGLYFIKIFYNEIFTENNENIRIIKDNKINRYIFGKEKFILAFERNIINYNIDNLFTKEDNDIFYDVMNKISYFYSINQNKINDIYNLLKYSKEEIDYKENNFILNIVGYIYLKRVFIYNNFSEYKNSLIKLEKQIFNLGKENLNINKNSKIINKYSINEEQKLIYNSLLDKINQNINNIYKGKFNLYPVGSSTEFLNSNISDIDLYLDINQIEEEKEKIAFVYHLKDILSKIINEPINVYISRRLCIILFKYPDLNGNQTDFDISITGFRSYFHSILFRTYSLIDARFSLLAITLKKFIQLLNINSKSLFMNSFCWMVLLSTFLQDIIKPPILPKLLSDKNNIIKSCKINYPNYYNNDIFDLTFESFITNIQSKKINLPECLFDKKSLFEIYKEQTINGKKLLLEKNNLSCSEIFLQFLEFIIFYFNKNLLYVNCSIENEGYESMNNILNSNDENFIEYYKNIYAKKIYTYDNEIQKDGEILIRDPIDPNYNPAHTFNSKNYFYFINSLKRGYLNLLKYGDLFKVNK